MYRGKLAWSSCKGLSIVVFLISSAAALYSQQSRESNALSTPAGTLSIPTVTGSLTIDGKLDDPAWESARSLPLRNAGIETPVQGGMVRVGVRGRYLCASAEVPEAGRLVAHSTGANPTWWREDMIVWMLRYRSPLTNLNMSVSLAVNPLGAYSLWGARGGGTSNARGYPLADVGTPLEWSNIVLAAAATGPAGWTAEIALPLEQLGEIGFVAVERIRAARPDMPELHFYWPAASERTDFVLGTSNSEPAPAFRPPSLPQNPVVTASTNPEDPVATEVATLPTQVWTQEQQETLGVRQQWEKSIRARMTDYAQQEKLAWQQVTTVAGWESFRDSRLSALRDSIGLMPERTPLRPAVTRRINLGDGFIIENIVFESRPHLLVTANLYLPEAPSGRIPAVVFVHSHHAPKTQSELQDLGMTMARSGTAVLVMDQLCAGERIQSQPWSREGYYARYTLGNQLYLAGESLIKWMVWDLMRGIDLLIERPEIDPHRIVLFGACAGGGDPAALTAALDPRVAAVIPMNFGEAGPEEHYTEGPRRYDFETADPGWAYWETTRNLPHSVSQQFFPWLICVSGAPRPFLYAIEIGWPKTVEEEPAWARYKKVYELYGARERLAATDGLGPFPGPGEFTNVSSFWRKRIDPILNRWLQIPVPRVEYHNLQPESALMCLTPAVAADYRPKPASALALELSQKRLAESRAKRAGLPKAEGARLLRDELRRVLGDIEPGAATGAQTLWTQRRSSFAVDALAIETEPGVTLPVLLLKPNGGAPRRPGVIALAQGGKGGFLSTRPSQIARLLGEGVVVCLPDLRGDGELSSETSRGPGAMGLAANELMLGRTLTGLRLKDARTLYRWLAARSDIDADAIGVWGDSFSEPNAPDFRFDRSPGQQPGPLEQRQAEPLGPTLALLTALFEERIAAVAARGGLVSFSSTLEDRFSHVPQDVIVPGQLEVADLGDIVAAIGERPVLLEQLVDGLNKRVASSAMEKEYGVQTPRLILREEGDDPSLPVWLARQCRK